MNNTIVAVSMSALVLAGCAGRNANPVAEVQPGDAALTCRQLSNEVQVNNQAIFGLIGEKKKSQGGNVAAGVGAVIFLPALFFMNVKGAAGEEARAYQRRNQGLISRYNAKGCKPEIRTMTDADYVKAQQAAREQKTAEELVEE
ncbi:hypothetical protein MNBD_ALPHA07-2025 [hydrothermal vent metagenome]|uniref:Uncharacterized protein n=1 Tax=hydrothermal vent metagenome TaxID=652676 RepID=A0A3B0SJK9_9ZZZZ